MADEHHEALRRLEHRLGQASAAADRLAEQAKRAGLGESRDAAQPGEGSGRQADGSERREGEGSGRQAGDRAKPPPAGWQTPPKERSSAGAGAGAELDALL